MKKIGERLSLVNACLFLITGVVISAIAQKSLVLVFGQAAVGVGVGVICALAPGYVYSI
jgi:cyanate permease